MTGVQTCALPISHAKCDGQQSLTPAKFDALMQKVTSLRQWLTQQA